MNIEYTNHSAFIFKSPVANLEIWGNDRKISKIVFLNHKINSTSSKNVPEPVFLAKKWLLYYFSGQKVPFFNIKWLNLEQGTAFQQMVWRMLNEIPYGETASYADIARKIQKPKASRAVGNANGANPFPILIPCHRVIASNGAIGGYSCGLSKKKMLMKIENIIL